jgi:cephalosporin hydroxylase
MARPAWHSLQLAQRVVAKALERSYHPRNESELPDPLLRSAIADAFNRLWYHDSSRTWRSISYRGVRIAKCPLDLWIYQELLWEVCPDLIVETGTAWGGSAYFLADLCELNGRGRVVSVDVEPGEGRPSHPRIKYLHGSSVDPRIVSAIEAEAADATAVMVLLDSDHSFSHVLAELRALSPLVTPGSYVVVEDTNVNGHPVLAGFGPGPMEAVDAFLSDNPDFEVDQSANRLYATFNPRGYLKRR